MPLSKWLGEFEEIVQKNLAGSDLLTKNNETKWGHGICQFELPQRAEATTGERKGDSPPGGQSAKRGKWGGGYGDANPNEPPGALYF